MNRGKPGAFIRPPWRQAVPAPADFLAARPLAHWFAERVQGSPEEIGYRVEAPGVGWRDVTWRAMQQRVEAVALGLVELGLRAGHTLAFIGVADLDWVTVEIACQCAGAIFCAPYPGSTPEVLYDILRNAAPQMIVASSRDQIETLSAAEELGEALTEYIVICRDRSQGSDVVGDGREISLDDVAKKGSQILERGDGSMGRLVLDRTADEILRLCYTSGTTGTPKGAMLTSRNLIWAWAELFSALGMRVDQRDRTLTMLPAAQVTQAAFSVVLPIIYGSVAYIASPASNAALAAVNPTIMFLPARTGDERARELDAAIARLSDFNGAMRRWAVATRKALLQRHWDGNRLHSWHRVGWAAAGCLLPRTLLRRFGLGGARFVYTGGAPIALDLIKTLHACGVEVMEIYGSTEIAGLATVHVGTVTPGVVGVPMGRTELRLADDGEILLRSPALFRGYWRDTASTEAVFDHDGWFHTGDISRKLVSGKFTLVDRRSDFVTLRDGSSVSASACENVFKRSPYVREAILVGHGRPYLTALVELEPASFPQLLDVATSLQDLTTSEEVTSALAQILLEANAWFASHALPAVKDVRALPRLLDATATDEITASGKVRRRAVAEKFQALADEMYS